MERHAGNDELSFKHIRINNKSGLGFKNIGIIKKKELSFKHILVIFGVAPVIICVPKNPPIHGSFSTILR